MPNPPRTSKASKARSKNELTRLQDAQLSAIRRVSKAVARVVPQLPRPPLADRLPTANRAVNGSFDRAQRLLENQRAFAFGLVEALKPLTSKIGPRKRAKRKQSTAQPRARVKPIKVELVTRSEKQDQAS